MDATRPWMQSSFVVFIIVFYEKYYCHCVHYLPAMDTKKKRNVNFTKAEKFALVEIIDKEKYIIENKKTDAVSSKQKEACWSKIAAEFNSRGVGECRNETSLKSCWDNMKKKTRKHFAEVRRELFVTGGGTMDIPEDTLCDRVRAVIEPSVDGLSNPFDSDATLGNEEAVIQKFDAFDENENESMVVETLDEAQHSDWRNWNSQMLTQKKSKELELTRSEEQLSFADVDAALSNPSGSKSQPCPSSLRSLKRKKSLAATSAMRVNATTRNKHFVALAQSKVELVEMMKEDMRAKKEIEMQILKTQLEKERLEVELLKKEIEIKDAILRGGL